MTFFFSFSFFFSFFFFKGVDFVWWGFVKGVSKRKDQQEKCLSNLPKDRKKNEKKERIEEKKYMENAVKQIRPHRERKQKHTNIVLGEKETENTQKKSFGVAPKERNKKLGLKKPENNIFGDFLFSSVIHLFFHLFFHLFSGGSGEIKGLFDNELGREKLKKGNRVRCGFLSLGFPLLPLNGFFFIICQQFMCNK